MEAKFRQRKGTKRGVGFLLLEVELGKGGGTPCVEFLDRSMKGGGGGRKEEGLYTSSRRDSEKGGGRCLP